MGDNPHTVWAEISLTKFLKNIQNIKSKLNRNVKLMAVVKADAYGHGASQLSKTAETYFGINKICFGIARIEEGIELRKNGIKSNCYILSGASLENCKDIIKYDLIPAICTFELARKLNSEAKALNIVHPIQIKVDTGMNRYGLPVNELEDFILKIQKLNNIKIVGYYSHLADPFNKEFSQIQINKFESAIKIFSKFGIHVPKHLLSSDGLINYPKHQYDMVRIGRLLYEQIPIMEWKAKLSCIKKIKKGEYLGYGCTYQAEKDIRIGILMCGYADGLKRELSNKGYILIDGVKCSLIGKISMDQAMIDITNTKNINLKSIAIILGKSRNEVQTAYEMGKLINTINYEIWTSISKRVHRVYFKNTLRRRNQ